MNDCHNFGQIADQRLKTIVQSSSSRSETLLLCASFFFHGLNRDVGCPQLPLLLRPKLFELGIGLREQTLLFAKSVVQFFQRIVGANRVGPAPLIQAHILLLSHREFFDLFEQSHFLFHARIDRLVLQTADGTTNIVLCGREGTAYVNAMTASRHIEGALFIAHFIETYRTWFAGFHFAWYAENFWGRDGVGEKKIFFLNSQRMSGVTLSLILDQAKKRSINPVRFHRRPSRYKFGVENYGEFFGWKNCADNCLWDAFAPGYTRRLQYGRKYKVKRITGIVFIENGNHKIAVELYVPGISNALVDSQGVEYARRYAELTGKKTEWISADHLSRVRGHETGSLRAVDVQATAQGFSGE